MDNGMEYKNRYRYRYRYRYKYMCRTYVGSRERNGTIVPIGGYCNITTTITRHPKPKPFFCRKVDDEAE